jgi:hypothetical protein
VYEGRERQTVPLTIGDPIRFTHHTEPEAGS